MNLDFNHNSLHEMMIEKLSSRLNHQLDNAIIEGLKRKGFEFETNTEVVQFLKTRCKSEDYVKSGERVMFVDDIPFMKWNYRSKEMPKFEGNILSASLGNYQFL